MRRGSPPARRWSLLALLGGCAQVGGTTPQDDGAGTDGAGDSNVACDVGDVRPCEHPSGFAGTETCDASGAFGACALDTGGVDDPALWLATELLGRPTADGVTLNLVPAAAVELFVELAPEDGAAHTWAGPYQGTAGEPVVVELHGMPADAAFDYTVWARRVGQTAFAARPTHHAHTARAPGSSFVFTIQADSHLDDKSSVELYHRTLELALSEHPDFHIDLGDTFMCEKHSAPLTAEVKRADSLDVVLARYLSEREHFDRIAADVPLFLVNGNHEGEAGTLNDGTANNVAVWATLARKRYYPNPEPGGLYSSIDNVDPLVGVRQQPYAWTWGDALFVVLDPFWFTVKKSTATDRWAWTLGDAQYAWLRDTLMDSDAKYKFVFAHHIVGGNDTSSRGGVEAAPYFEWGGHELDGSDTFAAHRPGWDAPIHDMFVASGVSAFFHGHDHVYVRQELDGVVYQEVPQPSATNYRNGAMLAQEGGYVSGTILGSSGHLKVSVTPSAATVEYVRSYLPADEGQGRVNGSIDDAYTITPR